MALFIVFYQVIYLLNMEVPILPRENGPFKYDVYLGFSAIDLRMMCSLQEKLEQHGLQCYPKYDLACTQRSTKSAIAEGVARSRKCLLYISPSFIEDHWYKMEVATVLQKAKRFSRDMVIVLKDPQLADVPSEFKEFTEIPVPDTATLENLEFLNSLAAVLKKGTYYCTTETHRLVMSPDHLKYAINKWYEWSNVWQLQIAVDKCFVCNIHRGNQRLNAYLYNYVLNTHVLEKVDAVRDLGIHVNSFLKFDCHISFIVHKAMTRAHLILKCFLSVSLNRELL